MSGYEIVALLAGLLAGMLLTLYATRQERSESRERIHELTEEVARLKGELTVKQNIIEGQNDRINRQRKMIERRAEP